MFTAEASLIVLFICISNWFC